MSTMIRIDSTIFSIIVLTIALSSTFLGENVIAHPGGIEVDGCHTNRKTSEYHCHGGSNQVISSQVKTRMKIPCNVSGGRCSGCGCHGGPGFRSKATGKCVSFKNLNADCGDPPTSNCVFENAPGTGENKECALSK